MLQQGHQHADAPLCIRVHQQPYQHQGNKDGHGVVKAGFDFQGACHPLIQGDAGALDHAEYRRRIGGANNATQQQAHAPVHPDQPGGKGADQGGGDSHAEGGQAKGRAQAQLEGA